MYSIGKLKKITIFEAFNLKYNEAVGYFEGRGGRLQRRKFTFVITENGNAEIRKPISVSESKYREFINKLGRERDSTFAEIKKMYSLGTNNSKITT